MKPRSTRCLRSGGRPLRNVPRRGPVHRRNILMLIGYNANVLTLLTCMVRSVAKAAETGWENSPVRRGNRLSS